MNQEQANNMLKLAMFLRSVPHNKFDMSEWVRGDHKCLSKLDCRTTACAAGYLPMVFPNEWEWRKDYIYDAIYPALYRHASTWLSLGIFFGLDATDLEYLFGYHKRTPKQEADILEYYVREHYENS